MARSVIRYKIKIMRVYDNPYEERLVAESEIGISGYTVKLTGKEAGVAQLAIEAAENIFIPTMLDEEKE